MTEKIVVRIFQEVYRGMDNTDLFKTEVVGKFTNEFDADFFIKQAIKEKLYSWTDIINQSYIKLDTYPSEIGGEINAEHN